MLVARRRKRRRDGEVRDHKITVQYSKDELGEIRRAAEERGLRLSAFVAQAALEAAQEAPRRSRKTCGCQQLVAVLLEQRRQVAGAAANLNQLTRYAHIHQLVPDGVAPAMARLVECAARLDEAAVRVIASRDS
ncbi:hypothetical protein Snas_6241 [Stackebrandtia nassauensis DSM 44728]|uniref:Bacterial mobilisation domain-containing protein n=1 Tax=Stackebrandtia nassauensis (strain DSM 44728 / CIP 108903 / NRRL B-16338 / NBRC 102104 / LLR-40K-21) TaxID=446470 RepID=D3Q2W1_STANL|nr:hypothetical protein Snas_6241 [Stackebrandtia nassauensis DSM 44728]